jgi:tetratricopeptide (TPR) repeat protein
MGEGCMRGRNSVSRPVARAILNAALAFGVILFPARFLYADECQVVHHGAPSEARKALLAADFVKAESLYRADLAAHPGDPELTAGLVQALLRQQKAQEAADTVQAALTASPNTAALITLRGEVEYRQGFPWLAAKSANDSVKLDPCNPQTLLLLANLARISSLYAFSQRQLLTAHRLDPEDPEIRSEWMGTLPIKQRISELEAYLAQPSGHDEDDLRHMNQYLERLRKLALEPHKPCRLVSSVAATDIPFQNMMRDATHVRAFGLDVKLNNRTARLQIDTGAGGLLVSRSVAEHAGLTPFSETEMSGIGDKGFKPGYTAFADSIRIGNLEFQDCSVRVLDSRNVLDDADGLIGMDVFSSFLVTLDYPMHKLILGPLPPRPGETAAAPAALNTNTSETQAADSSNEPAPGSAPAAATPAPKPPAHGPYDRYIAPEMKDYTPVYRVGHDLILPASLNGDKLKLFIMDTGSFATTISPDAAREVTKVHSNDQMTVHGISGNVERVYSADDITFRFAHLQQKVNGVVAFDTSKISKGVGMEISGFLGATTLELLTIHIDYRDGLVKFDYDPNRGFHR